MKKLEIMEDWISSFMTRIIEINNKVNEIDYKGYFEDSSLVIRMVIILSTFFCLIFYNSSENIISSLVNKKVSSNSGNT